MTSNDRNINNMNSLNHNNHKIINVDKYDDRTKYQQAYRSGELAKMQREAWLATHPGFYPDWRKNNREKYNEQQRNWRQNNHEKRQPYMRIYMRQYRQCYKILVLMNNLCKTCKQYDKYSCTVTLLRIIDQYCLRLGLYPK